MFNIFKKRSAIKEYKNKLMLYLQDLKISSEEENELKFIADKYKLSNEDLIKIQKVVLSDIFKKIISDKRISEEEKKSLENLLIKFNLTTKDIRFDQNLFNKYYSLSLIDNGKLPEIKNSNHDINIIFEDGEILHFGSISRLIKFRRETMNINYGGMTGSIKIMKGVRYRVGSIGISKNTKEVSFVEDKGIFYITNKRIGYIGNKKQFSLVFDKIISFELRPVGIYIFKKNKETPYIIAVDDYDLPLSIISFIINRN